MINKLLFYIYKILNIGMIFMKYVSCIVIFAFFFFSSSNEAQWSSSASLSLVEESKAIQFSGASSINIGQIVYSNNYFYGIIRFTMTTLDYSMLIKRDTNFLNGWSITIQMQTLDQTAGTTAIGNSFDLSSTISFMVFWGVIDPTITHNAFIGYITESSGSLLYSYKYSNIYLFHSIILSEDDTDIFVVGRDSSSNGVICSFSSSLLSSGDWKIYTSIQTLSLDYLSSSNLGDSIFVSYFDKSSSPNIFVLSKATTDSGVSGLTFDWTSKLNYYNSALVTTIRSNTLYTSWSSSSSSKYQNY